MKNIRVELNLTLACNHKCPSCDRLCNHFPERECHMTLDQIDRFCTQAEESTNNVKRVKVVGGEPLLHPEYREVHDRLCIATDQGVFDKVKIQSNGTIPRPDGLVVSRRVYFSGKPFRKRKHYPIWSPEDYNQPWSVGCPTLSKCGFSLDTYGWLPCSPAIAIVGVFGLEYLYRDKIPTEPWGLEELCRHCINAGPSSWRNNHILSFADMDDEHRTPSSSWQSRIVGWNGLPRKERW